VNSSEEKDDSAEDVEENKDSCGESVIDLRALFGLLSTGVEVKAVGKGKYVLSGITKRGNRAVAYVEPEHREGCFRRVELYLRGTLQPFMVLDEIVMNIKLSEMDFVLPRDELLRSNLSVRELKTNGFLNIAVLTGYMTRAVMVRLVLAGTDNAEIIKAVENMYSGKFDRKQLREKDEESAAILRSILSGKGVAGAERK